jgi:hypothetical protein
MSRNLMKRGLAMRNATMNVRIEEKCLIRYPCLVCGGWTEKDNAQPTVRVDGRDWRLCDQCLEKGPEGIKAELVDHAAGLQQWARELRQLATETWSVPTMAELEAFREKVDADLLASEARLFYEAVTAPAEASPEDVPF